VTLTHHPNQVIVSYLLLLTHVQLSAEFAHHSSPKQPSILRRPFICTVQQERKRILYTMTVEKRCLESSVCVSVGLRTPSYPILVALHSITSKRNLMRYIGWWRVCVFDGASLSSVRVMILCRPGESFARRVKDALL
jgi:hypothetical protein